ncbi:MAG: hypothetical protein JWO80_981 [Bryobacterales bacterium]|nr:hypothetical protein [Bryobacterales bacterium]
MEPVQADQNKGDSERIERIEQECRWISVVDPIIVTRLASPDYDRAAVGQIAQALHPSLKPKVVDRLLGVRTQSRGSGRRHYGHSRTQALRHGFWVGMKIPIQD